MTLQQPTARLRPFRPIQFGRYTLLAQIGAGGMGEIFLARMEGAQGFEKYCVIKKILPQLAEEPDFVDRFVSEARVLARLAHGSIAQVLDVGLHEGDPYIALEHVDGKDLRKVASRMRERHLPPPLTFVLYVMSRVLDALAYAHRKRDDEDHELNLVHRDISPQNVLVSYEGEVKIIDFGLAKSTLSISKTNPSIVMGKFLYMSPEQARHQQVDRRSDLYSVGLCMYELIAGKNPFDDAPPGELMALVADPKIAPLQEVDPLCPGSVSAMVMRALALSPSERFQSAEEFRAKIGAALHEIDFNAGPETVSKFMRETFSSEYQAERRLLAGVKEAARAAVDERSEETGVRAIPADSAPRRVAAPDRAPAPPRPAAPAPELAPTPASESATEHEVPLVGAPPEPPAASSGPRPVPPVTTGPRLVPLGNMSTDAYADTNPRVLIGQLVDEVKPPGTEPAQGALAQEPSVISELEAELEEPQFEPDVPDFNPDELLGAAPGKAEGKRAAPASERPDQPTPAEEEEDAAAGWGRRLGGLVAVLVLLLVFGGVVAYSVFGIEPTWPSLMKVLGKGSPTDPPVPAQGRPTDAARAPAAATDAGQAAGASTDAAQATAVDPDAGPTDVAPAALVPGTEAAQPPVVEGPAEAAPELSPLAVAAPDKNDKQLVPVQPEDNAEPPPRPPPAKRGKKHKKDAALSREWQKLKALYDKSSAHCSQRAMVRLCDLYGLLRTDYGNFEGGDAGKQELMERIRDLAKGFEAKRGAR